MTAVLAGQLAALAFAAAQYPVALVPVVLLPICTAAALLPARRPACSWSSPWSSGASR